MELKKDRKVVGPFVDKPKTLGKKVDTSIEKLTKALPRRRTLSDFPEDASDLELEQKRIRVTREMKAPTPAKTFGKIGKNKIRLWDILTRVILLGEYGIPIKYAFVLDVKSELTLEITFPVDYISEFMESSKETLKINTEDWRFDLVLKRINKLDEEHQEALAKERKRNEILSRLSEEERVVLGYPRWKEPSK
jgi:hypothetical protein